MKIKHGVLQIVGISLLCTGCANKWTNVIVAGSFEGIPEQNDKMVCKLDVKSIDKETFDNAKGKNVIKDRINDNYYSLSFVAIDETGVEFYYDFYNLKESGRGKTKPVLYTENSQSTFEPVTSSKDDTLEKNSYTIFLKKGPGGNELNVKVVAK